LKGENSVQSIMKAVAVLKSFTIEELELGAVDIARKVRLPKTTARRMLTTLAASGLLERNGDKSKYSIGRTLYILGSLYLRTTNIFKVAEPVVKILNELTSEAVNVGFFDKGNVILVMKEEPKYLFRWAVHVGTVIPAYSSAIGKGFLSELTEAELDSVYPEERLLPITKKTIPTKMKLKQELELMKKTALFFDREEFSEGIEGVGSLIRDASGKVVASMSISVPVFRANQAYFQRLAKLIKLGTSLVSYRLGYQGIEPPIHRIEELRSWWDHTQPAQSTSR